MNLKEIKNAIDKKKVCVLRGAPGLNYKEVIVDRYENGENGRIYGIVHDLKDEGKNLKRIDIRYIGRIREINEPKPFPEDKREELEKNEQEDFEAYRLIGRSIKNIRWMLAPEMCVALEKTMMVHTPRAIRNENDIVIGTTRVKHYANSGRIAYRIADGLFPRDTELALGIGEAASVHDLFGQGPYGHSGEEGAKNAYENYGGILFPHGPVGATVMMFRKYDDIKFAINEGIIIEEARRIIDSELETKDNSNLSQIERRKDYVARVNAKIEEIKERIELGEEEELAKKIQEQTEKNGDLTDKAIKLLVMGAGNHNGERGTANIVPNYELNFEDFWQNIFEAFLSKQANNKLVNCNIGDAIVKIADQLSSIPFDMIDGKRSNIDKGRINDIWVKPVARILRITEEEARNRLDGNFQELERLVLEIQDQLIENLVENSNAREINMPLAPWLYGIDDEVRKIVGIRTPIIDLITKFAGGKDGKREEVIINNLFCDLTDKLVGELLCGNKTFDAELNLIFRLEKNNQFRHILENKLKQNYKGPTEIKDFYSYCLKTSAKEYYFLKELAKAREKLFLKKAMENAYQSISEEDALSYINTNTIEFIIRDVMQAGIDVPRPDKEGHFSDKQVETLKNSIETYLKTKPEYGVQFLDVVVQKKHFSTKIGKENVGEGIISPDEQIAAHLALTYLTSLSDEELLRLGMKLHVLEEGDYNFLHKPYDGIPSNGHANASLGKTLKDYKDANKVMQKDRCE